MHFLDIQKTGLFIHRSGGKPMWIKCADGEKALDLPGKKRPQSGETVDGDNVDNGFGREK